MSTSKTKTNSTSIINESEIKQMNKSMNKYVSNVLIKNQQECSAMTIAETGFSIGNVKSETGDFNLEKSSTQDASTALQCFKAEAISKDLQSFVYENVLETIETSKSAEVWDVVDKTIEKSGNSKKSKETIDIMNRNKQVNTTHKNIQNYVANVIEKNLNIDNVSKCVNTVRQKQIMEFGDLEAGEDIDVTGIVQKQQINSTTSCIMELDVMGTLFEDFENMAGNNLKKNPNKISKKSESTSEKNEVTRTNKEKKSESSKKSKSKQSKSSKSSGFMKYIYYIIVVVVVLIIIIGGYYFYKSKKDATTVDQNTITSVPESQTSIDTQTSINPTSINPTSINPTTQTSTIPTTSYSSHTSVHYIPFPVECPPIEIPIMMPLPLPFPIPIKSQRY
jgi:hypothetical protein